MINKKTKSFGVVLLSILMIFSLVIFTACEPLDPADPPSNPPSTNQPAETDTNADAKTILNKAKILLNQTPVPTTATVEVGTSAMTEYKGIDGWELNSVDLTEQSQQQTAYNAAGLSKNAELFSYLLNEELVSVNENYVPIKDLDSNSDYRFKIELQNNKMILKLISYHSENLSSVMRILLTFDDEFEIQNCVLETFHHANSNSLNDCMVFYLANSSSYRVDKTCADGQENTLPVSINGALQSMKAELTKPVKQIEPIEININEILNS